MDLIGNGEFKYSHTKSFDLTAIFKISVGTGIGFLSLEAKVFKLELSRSIHIF